MAEQFYTILTNTGKAKIANSLPTGTKVNLTTLKVGDANGTYYNPSESQTALVHSVYSCNITSVDIDADNPNWITITSVIPSDVGGFMIREAGVFDSSGALIAVGKYPETYKPIASDGSTKELYIKMTLEITNASSVELKIDPTVIIATKKDINILTNSIASINIQLSEIVQEQTIQNTSIANKVDKVTGKGLSTNDYDNTEKAQVSTNKSDITTIKSQVSSLASGSPKAVLLVASMTDTTKNYVYSGTESGYVSGNWYYYNGSAWVSGGVYQSTGIADSAVNEDKTIFFDLNFPINVCDGNWTAGYIQADGGIVAGGTSYVYTTNFIKVKVGKVVIASNGIATVKASRQIVPLRFVTCYDENKNVLSALGSSSAINSFTVPSGVKYTKVTVSLGYTQSTLFQISVTDDGAQLDYQTYSAPYYSLKTAYYGTKKLTTNDFTDAYKNKLDNPFKETDTKFFDTTNSYNKFNVNEIVVGYYNDNTGVKVANANYTYTGYMAVSVGDIIVASNADGANGQAQIPFRYVTAYDSSKVVISASGKSTESYSYAVPSGVSYIILTFSSGYLDVNSDGVKDRVQIEATTDGLFTKYKEYNIYKLKNKYEFVPPLDVYLPSEIYCAIGRTIELYNNQVCLQADKYHMNWVCSVGKAMKRKFSITGATVGNYTLTLNIVNDDLEVIWKGSTTLKIIDASITNSYTCCPIGDSLSNNKKWLAETINLSGGKISYIGKIPWSNTDANGNTKTGHHEGRSGFSALNYLTATPYSGLQYGGIDETVHAFWDATNNRFNWSYYKTQNSVNPSFVQIFLGTNGIALNPNNNANNIKSIIDYIRQDDANIPIYLVNTLYRSNQNGIGVQVGNDGYASYGGQYKYMEDKKVFNLMVRLNELLSSYTNLHFIPIALTHDTEYNFGAVSTPVNPRASQTELLPSESVHCQDQGYYQMADIMFSTFAGTLS